MYLLNKLTCAIIDLYIRQTGTIKTQEKWEKPMICRERRKARYKYAAGDRLKYLSMKKKMEKIQVFYS